MPDQLIDIWDRNTFPPCLLEVLSSYEDVFRNYLLEEKHLEVERENDPHLSSLLQKNVFYGDYERTIEGVAQSLELQTFRGWHYTRLTEAEVELMSTQGIKLSTVEFLAERLKPHSSVRRSFWKATASRYFKTAHSLRDSLRTVLIDFGSHPIHFLIQTVELGHCLRSGVVK